MAGGVPGSLTAAVERLLEGVSRKDLAVRAARISDHYRAGGGSATVIAERSDIIAYLVTRLPATFAAITAVFDEVRGHAPDFAPASILDAGAGPGTASFAAVSAWPGIAAVTMLDASPRFLAVAEELAATSGHAPLAGAARIVADMASASAPRAELVVVGFALAEVPAARLPATVAELWERSTGMLVLIEPGTPAGFARIRAARAALARAGAAIVAPCPHALACPIISPDWCHFAVRLPRSRDHKIAKSADAPFEDEKFSYVAAARPDVAVTRPAARVLAPPRVTKAEIALKLCTPNGIQHRVVPRRDRTTYAQLRKAGWGDALDA